MKHHPIRFLAVLILPLIAACATSAVDPEPAPKDPAAKALDRKKVGPSLAYEEDDRSKNDSLLVRTEKQDQEILALNTRILKAEQDRDLAIEESRKAKEETRTTSRERDEIRRLLDEALAKERGLVEQAAAAEIERLKIERQLIECKLAMLVREAK